MFENNGMARIEEALVEAHNTRPLPETAPSWNRGVMARVRTQAFEERTPAETQRIVWRFATAICLVATVCAVYAVHAGVGPEGLALHLLLADPLDWSAWQVFTL